MVLKNSQGMSLLSFLIAVILLGTLYQVISTGYKKAIQTAKKETCQDIGGTWKPSGKKCSIKSILDPLNNRITDNPELSKIKITLDEMKKSIQDLKVENLSQIQKDRFSPQPPTPNKKAESDVIPEP